MSYRDRLDELWAQVVHIGNVTKLDDDAMIALGSVFGEMSHFIENRDLVEQMKDLIYVQGTDGTWNYSEYHLGMYNGMVLMLSLVDGTDPEFKGRPDTYLIEVSENRGN